MIPVVLFGGLAFASHSSKAATRLAVKHGPETLSNIGLSAIGIRCAATKKIKGLRNSIGYLTGSDEEILFVAKRFFRYRVH